jgi:ketosteroid isomerase-like protein
MGETEKAVAAQERQWLQSQKTNNADLLAPLLADKFISTGQDGKVTNKAQTLADAKATHWTSAEYENVEVVAYGDAAVATGVYIGKGTDSKGKPMNDVERFTDTWVKMPGGKWQCVASQASPVKK